MPDPRLEAVLGALLDGGMTEAEAYAKSGRSRSLEWQPAGEVSTGREEQGWAVRAGDRRSSFFVTGNGIPSPSYDWPSPDGYPIRLPAASTIAEWSAPDGLDIPLMIETDARELFRGVLQELRKEIPEARILRSVLEDGSSQSVLVSSRGTVAESRHRMALLHVEAVGERGAPVVLEWADRAATKFSPTVIARRLVDRLLVQRAGTAPSTDRADYLLAPDVGAVLLSCLTPLLVGSSAPRRVERLLAKRSSFARPVVSIVDDGRLVDGLLSSPADGEGVATRETVLVERGLFRQPLLTWSEAEQQHRVASGCSRRASFRDLPRRGPTHLYWRPNESVSVGSLLARVTRGYYLLATTGMPYFDFEADQFELPVCGFVIRSGRAHAPLAGARLSGAISGLLHGVQEVARDIAFFPLDGMIGSPTLLVTGLEIGSF